MGQQRLPRYIVDASDPEYPEEGVRVYDKDRVALNLAIAESKNDLWVLVFGVVLFYCCAVSVFRGDAKETKAFRKILICITICFRFSMLRYLII